MKEYSAKDIRNFALVGHGGSGKTMLAEAMLSRAGLINRIGSIESGNTVSDYHHDAPNIRGLTIFQKTSPSYAFVKYLKGEIS